MNRYILHSVDGRMRGSFHNKWHALEAAKKSGLRNNEFYVVDTWAKQQQVS